MKKNLIVLGVVIALFGVMGVVMMNSAKNAGAESVANEDVAIQNDGTVKICPYSGLPCDGDGDCEGDGCGDAEGCGEAEGGCDH